MALCSLMEEEEPALGEEEQVPETPSVRSCLLIGEGGTPRIHDDPCFFQFRTDSTEAESIVYFIPIAEIEGKILAAVPFLAWHRVTVRRVLPATALTKATLVEVPALDLSDLDSLGGESTVRVWVGLISEEMFELAHAGDPEEPGALDFGEELGVKMAPSPEALIEVADEHFRFVTAPSGDVRSGEAAKKAPKRKAKPAMETRVSSLEDTLKQIQATLQELPAKMRGEENPAQPAPSRAKSKEAKVPGGDLPGLDPGMVASARAGGMPEAQLTRLSQMFARPDRMTEPALGRNTKRNLLSESEDDAEDAEEKAGEGAGAAVQPIEKAVVQLTKLVKSMSQRKKTGGGLEGILEKAESGLGSSEGPGSGGGSRSKAAAYKKLKEALDVHPEWIYQSVEAQMEEDYNQMRSLPGGALLPTTSRGWVEHRSRILSYPSTIRMAWALAGIHDALKSNNPALARAKTALALAAVDQSALDGGSWALAQEMTLEIPPPYHSFVNKRNPDPTEQPSTRLVEERFLEIMLWRLRDKDNYLESRKRLMLNNKQRLGHADKEETDKKGAKGGGKKDGKGSANKVRDEVRTE